MKVFVLCLLLGLGAQANAGFLKVVKAKYLPRSREIRIHAFHPGGCDEKFKLVVLQCQESSPVQCDLKLDYVQKKHLCKRLVYTIMDFPVEILGDDLSYFSHGLMTVHGSGNSYATFQLSGF